MIRAAILIGYVLVLFGIILTPQTNANAQIFRACRSRCAGPVPVRTTLPANAQKTSNKPEGPAGKTVPPDTPAAEIEKLPASEEPQNEPHAADTSVDAVKPSSSSSPKQANRVEQQLEFSGPVLPSGARVSLLESFLGDQPGHVLVDCVGATTECEIVEWCESSVTLQMPRWGLREPKMATLWIVMPDGRITSEIPFLLVPAPDIVIHSESVPVPLPPAPQ